MTMTIEEKLRKKHNSGYGPCIGTMPDCEKITCNRSSLCRPCRTIKCKCGRVTTPKVMGALECSDCAAKRKDLNRRMG